MAKNNIGPGPTAQAAGTNLRHFRTQMKMTQAQLSERLEDLGHPIPEMGIRRMETHKRTMSVDDLTALALALEVSPTSFLVPLPGEDGWEEDTVEVTGWPEKVSPVAVWKWLNQLRPITTPAPTSGEVTFFRAHSAVHPDQLED